MLIPIHRPTKGLKNKSRTVLAGDIGGTKTNLSIFEMNKNEMKLIKEWQCISGNYATAEDMIAEFYNSAAVQVNAVSLGVAGPVFKGKVKTTNLPWELSTADIGRRINVDTVFLINDLEANAYGIAMLNEDDLLTVYPGTENPQGNVAVIAPGTGLGEAGMFWDGQQLFPFATEGGHTSFAPRTSEDVKLFEYLNNIYGHVSWERLLSGPGIFNIFNFLTDHDHLEIDPALKDRIMTSRHPALIITQAALQGTCQVCQKTLHMFIRYLGEESAHLCLKLKATGGLFIGGGIVPDVLIEEFNDIFIEAFFKIGRMKSLLKEIPVKIIRNEQTALLGAAFYGAYF